MLGANDACNLAHDFWRQVTSHINKASQMSGVLSGSPSEADEVDVFHEEVFTANEEFARRMQGYLDWFQSDPNNRKWPVKYGSNKNSFRKQLAKYRYDTSEKVLYRIISRQDGAVGKFNIAILGVKRAGRLS